LAREDGEAHAQHYALGERTQKASMTKELAPATASDDEDDDDGNLGDAFDEGAIDPVDLLTSTDSSIATIDGQNESMDHDGLVIGYYRCVSDVEPFVAGMTVFLLSLDTARAHILRGANQWTMARADFATAFAFDPDGLAHRVTESLAASGDEVGFGADLALNPHLTDEGALTGVELTVSGATAPLETKRAVANLRNEVARRRADLEAGQRAMKAFAEEQAIILRAQTSALTEKLAMAEEAIWTINLYLGQDEEIVTLAAGTPAPADTPITIRQLVLYMDEECAVAADEGGIDARAIETFDTWLTENPAHLAQLLPEPKGMVALKPRRTKRDYGDAWVNTALNEANRKTYFLLRNGDNLYRMWTTYEVGERLIPKTDEFLGFFRTSEFNRDTNAYETVAFKPGSDAYMKAEKTAAAQQRHYMRAALVLQGLIDRTAIFRPLAQKIDVTDQASYESALSVVLDADLMLADGRERFRDWFARINAQIGVGMRIVGTFGSYEHGLRLYNYEKRNGNERISPRGASFPRDGLYTIAERRPDGFAFFYDRPDDWRVYERRATCIVVPGDRFILNVDAATLDELHFYLGSRLDRSDYTYLFPIIKRAIAIKRAELITEAPFALLLAGEIAKEHLVEVAEAQTVVPDLISWWKFKNRTHRALTSDDAKALRMIVAEFGLRAKQDAERAKRGAEGAALVARVLAQEPDALLIAHKAGPDYVALLPANDENIFVHEQTWTTRGRKAIGEWKTVDNRYLRWQVLYGAERFERWEIGAAQAEHLTDPERLALVDEARAAVVSIKNGTWSNTVFTKYDYKPLAATVSADGELHLFMQSHNAQIDAEHVLRGKSSYPGIDRAHIVWRRGPSRTPIIDSLPRQTPHVDLRSLPWDEIVKSSDKWVGSGKIRHEPQILWSDEVAIEAFLDACRPVSELLARRTQLQAAVHSLVMSFEKAHAARVEREAYERFIADFGDPDLWAGQRKTIKFPQLHNSAKELRDAIAVLIERDIACTGLTIGDIMTRAQAETADESHWSSHWAFDPLVADLRATT
jgi:hypothetical protein